MVKKISLHTSKPSKNQTENEATYEGYDRIAFDPEGVNVFPDCEEDKHEVLTHAAIGEDNKIEKVIALVPLTITRGPNKQGHKCGPQLHGPDLAGE
jgi:hypothetical protein